MKSGDLVKIKSNLGDGSFPVSIGSLSHKQVDEREVIAGSVALLLGDFDDYDNEGKLILIDGMIGWVWCNEIELIDEVG